MDDDVVAQFTEITGSSPKLASQYLELADFNLEQAIQLFFENGGAEIGDQSSAQPQQSSRGPGYEDESGVVHIDSDDDVQEVRSSSARPAASGATGGTFEDDAAMARRLQEELYSGGGTDNPDGVRAPMARTTERLVGPEADVYDDNDMNSAILSQLRTRQSRNNRPGIFNQRDTSSIWAGGESDSSHRASLAAATGGASETSSKSNMLAEMYRPPFELMSRLPWDLAREEGRENEKWIMVNVQDPSVFDCQVLNRDLWKDPAIKETIKEHFLFLQYSKDDPRAAPYLQYYFHGHDVSDNYPHIAIVDPRTGEQVKVWSGPPVVKPADFLMQLHEFLDRYSLKHNVRNPVAKRKPEKEKTVDAMTEEEMMEMALRNSLGGGEPARKVEDPDELTKGEDVEGKGKGRAVEEDEDMQDLEEETTASPFFSIPSDRPHVEPPADPATTTRIQFRHPSGRVIRRFALSDPVQRIYEWLKADPPLKEKAGVEFELNAMGQNLIEQLDTTIADAGLKNGTVMIQYIED
ncbi:UBX domain protein Ubx2 [Paecilomyces lecythidis]